MKPTQLLILAASPVLSNTCVQERVPTAAPDPPELASVPGVEDGAKVHRAPRPLATGAKTSDWPRFLGPHGTNVSDETHLARDWGDGGPPLVWELEVGDGYAAPSVRGDALVYFHREEDEEVVERLHPETGERAWSFRYPTDYRDSYGYSGGPRCTPLIDGERVYTYGVQGRLHCLALDTGEVLWERDLTTEYDVPQDFFGVVSTPVLHGHHLIVHVGAPGGPTVVALDRETGDLLWVAVDDWLAGYSTPVVARVAGKDRCFVFAGGKSRPPSGGLLCLDPRTGAVEFRFPWRSETYESVNASSPVVIDDKVFVSATYDTGGALLRVEPEGGYEVLWTSHVLSTHFNTPIHDDGYLYGFDGRNEPDASLVCQEVETGAEVWRTVLSWEDTFELHGTTKPRPMSVYRGTLLGADGDYLCLGERGHLLWLDLTPDGCTELARAWLFAAHETWTPPVLSRGLLYVTQNAEDFVTGAPPRLLCYDLRAGAD